jgi:hypothetical protein
MGPEDKMRIQGVALGLTIVNLVLLIVLLGQLNPLSAQEPAPVLRGRALQIVDDAGRVRASLSVLPAGDQSHETVLLRLITERGRPSVKVGASEDSSGISVAGPTGTQNTWITLTADGVSSSIVVKSEDGSEQIIQP